MRCLLLLLRPPPPPRLPPLSHHLRHLHRPCRLLLLLLVHLLLHLLFRLLVPHLEHELLGDWPYLYASSRPVRQLVIGQLVSVRD